MAVVGKSFRDIVLELVRKGHDLTLRQLLVMLECASTSDHQTIRGLAATCQVAKPVVTRAVDRLEKLGYAERLDDPADRRSVLIGLTRRGRVFAQALTTSLRE